MHVKICEVFSRIRVITKQGQRCATTVYLTDVFRVLLHETRSCTMGVVAQRYLNLIPQKYVRISPNLRWRIKWHLFELTSVNCWLKIILQLLPKRYAWLIMRIPVVEKNGSWQRFGNLPSRVLKHRYFLLKYFRLQVKTIFANVLILLHIFRVILNTNIQHLPNGKFSPALKNMLHCNFV